MDFPAFAPTTYTSRWKKKKDSFEKLTGKAKPGGWFSNRSGVTEALTAVDDSLGDLRVTVEILKKQAGGDAGSITPSMAKQLGTKVAALEKAEKDFSVKAAKYSQTAFAAVKSEGANALASKGAGDYSRNVVDLINYLGTLGEDVGRVLTRCRSLADEVRTMATKALKAEQKDAAGGAKLSKQLDLYELAMQKYGKAARDLQRKPDEEAYKELLLKILKARTELDGAMKACPGAAKLKSGKALETKLDKYFDEASKFKGVKKGQTASTDKDLLAAIKRVGEFSAELPKFVAPLKEELGGAGAG